MTAIVEVAEALFMTGLILAIVVVSYICFQNILERLRVMRK